MQETQMKSTMQLVSKLAGPTLAIVFGIGLVQAGDAAASPITMTPGEVSINSVVGNDFTLSLDAGESTTRTLDFTVTGGGGCGFLCPSTAVAAIVFDDATVLSATDADSGLFSANNVVRGIVTPNGAVAGLLIDSGAASSESFRLVLDRIPTTATLYSLSLNGLDQISSTYDILARATDRTTLTFAVDGVLPRPPASPMPEPGAALVFGLGLLVANAGIRRR